MKHINEIEGIGPSYAEKLESHGIKTVEDLLKYRSLYQYGGSIALADFNENETRIW
jgi:predicted RecB family nuclease